MNPRRFPTALSRSTRTVQSTYKCTSVEEGRKPFACVCSHVFISYTRYVTIIYKDALDGTRRFSPGTGSSGGARWKRNRIKGAPEKTSRIRIKYEIKSKFIRVLRINIKKLSIARHGRNNTIRRSHTVCSGFYFPDPTNAYNKTETGATILHVPVSYVRTF